MSEKNTNFHIGNGSYINIQTSSIIKLSEEFVVYTEDGPISLTVDIVADFAKIEKNIMRYFLTYYLQNI